VMLAVLLVLGVLSATVDCRRLGLQGRLGGDTETESEWQWFVQRLDHFDPQNQMTWKEKYVVNDQYWGGPGYPIFILLGGEGPIRNDSAAGHYILQEYAIDFKALVISAEHRFYGDSIPTSDLSTANLRYLSSAQALADYAALVNQIKQSYNTPDSKVVSFGGSYSGALSAWFRLKYPHLIHAALASSGPVQAQTNFPEYLEVIARSLATVPGCDAVVLNATQYYSGLLQTPEGKAKIEKDFNTCTPLSSDLDVVTFLEYFADTISEIVQYNNDNNGRKTWNIPALCSLLLSGPLDQTFPTFYNEFNQASGAGCSDSSYQSDVQALMNTDPTSPGAAGRAWYYQTCTEFGYYQTGEKGGIFSPNITLDYFVGQCQEVFGIDMSQVQANVDWTNEFYGARNIAATRIMFTNGDIDPWHALGITTQPSADLPTVLIHGTAHCADLYPSRSEDLPSLQVAREMWKSYLSEWLTQ